MTMIVLTRVRITAEPRSHPTSFAADRKYIETLVTMKEPLIRRKQPDCHSAQCFFTSESLGFELHHFRPLSVFQLSDTSINFLS